MISYIRRKCHVLVFTLLILMLSSCETKFDLPESPCVIPQASCPVGVRLALVLGGGGAKGMAHVGVLEEFENAGIPIDVIVGCSAGSIIGAIYADCPDASYVKKVMIPLRKWDVLDISVFRCRYGFVQGSSLKNFLKKRLSCENFEELQIPLYVVSTDLLNGEVVEINSGPIIPAVHASAAVPLVFSPVILYERLLVDGGVSDPVPVRTAKKTGAAVIVAVDIGQLLQKTCPNNLFGIAGRSAEIKFLLQSESCINGADVIIRPELGDMGLFDDSKSLNAYEAGRIAARKAIPRIQELLRSVPKV